jgi:predicted DsbA family dithiol-disulfide isomerase
LKEEFDIVTEWLPMEIHTETPSAGMLLSQRFPGAALESMFINLNKSGKKYNIDFNLNPILSNSHRALAMGEYAKEIDKFNELHEKIFYKYFTMKEDIGDTEVLLELADEIGMDRENLLIKLNEGYFDEILEGVLRNAHSYKINSTPTFILDNKYMVVGAQPIEVFHETLRKIEEENEGELK